MWSGSNQGFPEQEEGNLIQTQKEKEDQRTSHKQNDIRSTGPQVLAHLIQDFSPAPSEPCCASFCLSLYFLFLILRKSVNRRIRGRRKRRRRRRLRLVHVNINFGTTFTMKTMIFILIFSWRLEVWLTQDHPHEQQKRWSMNYLSPSSSPSVYLYLCYCCWGPKSCPTLCNLDPMDCSPPGCSVHGTSQARILEWVAISFSRRPSWPRDLCLLHWQVNSFLLSHQGTPFISTCVCVKSIQSCLTLCNRMDWILPGSSVHGILQERRLEWVAIPSSRRDLPDPGRNPAFLTSPALTGGFFTTSTTCVYIETG